MGKKNGLPANVTEYQDAHGTWYLRFRKKGHQTYCFKAKPGTEEFRAELEAWRAGAAAPKAKPGTIRVPPGSIGALVALYKTTAPYTGLSPASKKTYNATLKRFIEKHGTKPVKLFLRPHIKAIIGAMAATPQAANKLLSKIRILMDLAVDEGWVDSNPAIGVKGYSRKTDGFHTWSEDDIATYEKKYPLGTKARLASDILLYTGQRRSDGVKAGKQHVAGGRISVAQQKTSKRLSIPMHPRLRASIDAAEAASITGDLTFLVTEYGHAFTSNGFGNRMRDWCDDAGLKQCTAHGLRKAAARRLAEAGCTHEQIKAITGHVTDSEVSKYVAAASQIRLADQAIAAIGGGND